MNSVAMAVKDGRGYEILLAVYQLLKQAGDPDPAGRDSEIQDCLEFCRDLSLKQDQDSQEQMVEWVMWLANKLPPAAQDLSFVDNPAMTSELAQNALDLDEDEFQRRQNEEKESWAAMHRTVANDSSEEMQDFRLGMEVVKKLKILESMPQTPELQALCEQVDDAIWQDSITPEHLQALDRALAMTQQHAESASPAPSSTLSAPPIASLIPEPAPITQEMAAPGHWYHPRHHSRRHHH